MQSQIESGSMSFAIDVYRRLKRDQQNLVVSPFSLSAALSMTLMGCRGKTAEELSQALLKKVIPQKEFESLAKEFKTLVGGAIEANKKALFVGNFIYLHHNCKVLPDFKKTLEKNFSGKATEVDFRNSQEAVRKINDDISKATRGKIPQLLNRISADSRLILANAVYFKGFWNSEFSSEETKERRFTLSSKKDVQVMMMYQELEELYYKSDQLKCQAVKLPFKDCDTSMILLLPDKSSSLKSLESSLTQPLLDELIKSLTSYVLDIWLPRFKLESQHNLIPVLEKLGIKQLFTGKADLSGVSKSSALYVSDVMQNALIEVNEEGAEAAAVTYVDDSFISADPVEKKRAEFKADRPFMYLLISEYQDKNLVLFIGAVEDPR